MELNFCPKQGRQICRHLVLCHSLSSFTSSRPFNLSVGQTAYPLGVLTNRCSGEMKRCSACFVFTVDVLHARSIVVERIMWKIPERGKGRWAELR